MHARTHTRLSERERTPQHVSDYVQMGSSTSITISPPASVQLEALAPGTSTRAIPRQPHSLPEAAVRPTLTNSLIVEPPLTRQNTPKSLDSQQPAYGNLLSQFVNHQPNNQPPTIPQGSPLHSHPVRQIPIYYRDYVDPQMAPAYSFICHSSWYVQIEEDYNVQ